MNSKEDKQIKKEEKKKPNVELGMGIKLSI